MTDVSFAAWAPVILSPEKTLTENNNIRSNCIQLNRLQLKY